MYIVITLPHFFDGEAERITAMFQSGLQRLHLRKPGSDEAEYIQLLRDIPSCYHPRIVLHDHFALTEQFAVGGVHLNSRNPQPPTGWNGMVSTSCHSIAELRQRRTEGFDYLSLSPIYDSISKVGYNAAYTEEELLMARNEGITDQRVMALGGICHDNIDEALSYGFGGVMVLGDAWRKSELPVVLSIAGSDPSAGAGIQQDLKTMTSMGCYGTTVITALTTQNTIGVQDSMAVPASVVESQLRSILTDMRVEAVKIGMIPNRDVAEVLVKVLGDERQRRTLPIICDPILISTSGRQLMEPACIQYVVENLFPLCTLVTPNIPEYEYITQHHDIRAAQAVLLKGGHADAETMVDTLCIFAEDFKQTYSLPRVETRNLHGTGCTLSSAIACGMAKGLTLPDATSQAKSYIHRAIIGGQNLSLGHGNGPLWYV